MDCLKTTELFSLYIDGKLNNAQKDELEKHISLCGECGEELSSLKELISSLNDMEQIELPENYHEELMIKINGISKIEAPQNKKIMVSFKRFGAVAAGILLTLFSLSIVNVFISYMGSKQETNSGMAAHEMDAQPKLAATAPAPASVPAPVEAPDEAILYDNAPAAGFAGDGGAVEEYDAEFRNDLVYEAERSESDSVIPDETLTIKTAQSFAMQGQYSASSLFDSEKIEKTVTINLKVENISEAVKAINSLNGYNSSSEVSYSNPNLDKQYGTASITRRVGANELEYVRDILRNLGEVIEESEYQSNHTEQYDDLSVRAENAKNEIRRLGALIEKSNTLDNIIYVENRISDIDRQLDSYLGRMRQIQALTSEPYIRITLYANRPYDIIITPVSFAERMRTAFGSSVEFTGNALEGIAIFAVSSVVPLITFAVIMLFVILIVRKAARWKK